MQDKIVLITGGTGGIGKQTALALAKVGAQVIVTGRNKVSGEAAVAEIKQASGNPKVALLLADLTRQSAIRALAEEFKASQTRLDVLINNAGLAAESRQLTADGIESNFAVNVTAPFLLTSLLLNSLQASPSARVISVTGGDVPRTLDLDNLQSERSFVGLTAYSQSKLAMMVVMVEFAQRLRGSPVTCNICYPGQASTSMTRSVTRDMLPGGMRFMFPLFRLMTRPDGGKSAAKASQSSVFLASSAAVAGVTGRYYDRNCKEAGLPPPVLDTAIREHVWQLVEQLTTVSQVSPTPRKA